MKFILLALVLVGTSAAYAGDNSPLDSYFYMGAAVGTTDADDLSDDLSGYPDNSSGTWNIFAGYQVNPHIATELSYGSLYDTNFKTDIGRAGLDITALRGSVLLQAPITDVFKSYVRIGYQSLTVNAREGLYSLRETDSMAFGGIGLQYDWDQYFARLEATTTADNFNNLSYTLALGITF